MGIYPNSGKHSAKIIIQTPKFLFHQIKVFGYNLFLKTQNMFFAFKNRLPTHWELVLPFFYCNKKNILIKSQFHHPGPRLKSNVYS